MANYNNSVVVKFDTAQNGNAGAGASITVYIAGTQDLANITHEGSNPSANPLYADEDGNYSFEVDSGVYDLVVNEGNLSEVTLDNVIINDSEADFLNTPNTWTAPQTFIVPTVNDNGTFITGRFVETVEGDNSGDSVKVDGSYLLNEFDRSNSNIGTSTTKVTTEAGTESRITKRITVDNWTASGTVVFSGDFLTVDFGTDLVVNGSMTVDGSTFFGTAPKTRPGVEFIHNGQSTTTFSTLTASSTGDPLWDGVPIMSEDLLSSNNTWAGINTFNNTVNLDAPMNASAPIITTSPPQFTNGALWGGLFVEQASNPYGGNILQINGVRGLNTFDLSNSNTVGTESDQGASRLGIEEMMTRRLNSDLGTAASKDLTSPSSTIWDDGNLKLNVWDCDDVGDFIFPSFGYANSETSISIILPLNMLSSPSGFTMTDGVTAHTLGSGTVVGGVKTGADMSLSIVSTSRCGAISFSGYTGLTVGSQYIFRSSHSTSKLEFS